MTEYIKVIIVLILLKPILSGVAYGLKTEKYINFVVGLLIISSILIPFKNAKENIKFDFSHNFEKMNYEEIRKESVKKQVEDKLNKQFGTNDVDVVLDEQYNIIDVKSEKQMKIKEYLGI